MKNIFHVHFIAKQNKLQNFNVVQTLILFAVLDF